MERMATNNIILKVQVHGLQQAVTLEKKRRKHGKGLIKNMHTITDGKAVFWSPTRIQSTKDLLEEQEYTKQDEAFKKAKLKFQKRLQKEENARQVAQRRQAKEVEKEQKKASKNEAIQQRLVDQQLKLDLKDSTPRPSQSRKPATPKKQVHIEDPEVDDGEEVQILEIRTRRERKPIKNPRVYK
jgi:hypothetical protein